MSRAHVCSGASGLSLLLGSWAGELKMLALFMFKWGEQDNKIAMYMIITGQIVRKGIKSNDCSSY